MFYQKMIMYSNLLIFIGVILGGLGTFGKFYYEKKFNEGKLNVDPIVPSTKQESTSGTLGVDYLITSTGSGIFEIKHAYIEVLTYENFIEKSIQPRGTYGLADRLDGRDINILIEINSLDKYYPIPLYIFNDKEISSSVFDHNDFGVLQIHFSTEEKTKINIRMVIEGYDIKNKSNFIIKSKEILLEKRPIGLAGEWVKRYRLSIKNKNVPYTKEFYKVLTAGFSDYENKLNNFINKKINKKSVFNDLRRCIKKSDVHYYEYAGGSPGIYLQRCYDIAIKINDSRVVDSLIEYINKVPMREEKREIVYNRIIEISTDYKSSANLITLKNFLLKKINTIKKEVKEYTEIINGEETYKGSHKYYIDRVSEDKNQLDRLEQFIEEINSKLKLFNI